MQVSRDGEGSQCIECSHETDGDLAGPAHTYISGIELFFADRPSVILGHGSEEGHIFDTNTLRGFNVAFSNVGIHAMQVFAGSSPSAWAGESDDADNVKRLILDQVDILGSSFDVSFELHLM